MSASGTATYLYAVCRPFDPAVLRDATGVHDGPVRTLAEDDLVAVVETVPVDRFGEDALRDRLENVTELEHLVRGHDAVVQTVGAATVTVPLRLATLYHDDDGVRRVLRSDAGELREALARVAGRAEWSVKVYGTRARPSAPRAPAGPAAPGAGRDYLRRRRRERDAAEHSREALLREVAELDAALRRVADDVRHLTPRPAPPGEAGRDADVNLLNAAYLVSTEDAAAFTDELRRSASPSLRLEVGGPWVPYSFAAPELAAPRRPGDQGTGDPEAGDPAGPGTGTPGTGDPTGPGTGEPTGPGAGGPGDPTASGAGGHANRPAANDPDTPSGRNTGEVSR